MENQQDVPGNEEIVGPEKYLKMYYGSRYNNIIIHNIICSAHFKVSLSSYTRQRTQHHDSEDDKQATSSESSCTIHPTKACLYKEEVLPQGKSIRLQGEEGYVWQVHQ